MVEPDDPLVGTTLAGKYEVRRCLGRGGFGAVYEAFHTLLKRPVALKLLHPEVAADEAHLARFQREAQAAAALGHPNIVDVSDMGLTEDGSAYLVLELLDGRDLRAAVKHDAPFTVGRAARVITQVCDALEEVHAVGIVHRDLKPENVFLIARRGQPDFVKVLDFGVAKVLDGPLKEETMTATGTAIGTLSYMAPEQAQGRKDVDRRADLYAVGVMLWELLVGERPFGRVKPVEMLYKLVFEQAPRVRSRRSDVPEPVDELVSRLLAKAPDERPSSAQEVIDALAPFLDVDEEPATTAPDSSAAALEPTAPVAAAARAAAGLAPTQAAVLPTEALDAAAPTEALAPRPRSRAPWIAAGLAAVALVAGVVWVASAGEQSAPPSAAESEPPAPDAATVHVVIDVTPHAAAVRLDGEPLANPFDGELPASAEVHRLEATLDGYAPMTRELSLRLPQQVRFALEREDAGAPAVVERVVATPSRRRRAATEPAPAPEADPAPAPEPAPEPSAEEAPDHGLKRVVL